MAVKKKAAKKGNKTARAWEIGGAITAATLAAAAGAYLLSDKKTKAKAKKWVAEARKEIVKKAKMAKKLSEKEYGAIVAQTIKHYGSLEKLSGADVLAAGKELKSEWKKIQAHAKKLSTAYAPKKKTAKKARG